MSLQTLGSEGGVTLDPGFRRMLESLKYFLSSESFKIWSPWFEGVSIVHDACHSRGRVSNPDSGPIYERLASCHMVWINLLTYIFPYVWGME